MNTINRVVRWVIKKINIYQENIYIFFYKVSNIANFFINLLRPVSNNFLEEDIEQFIDDHYKNYKPDDTLNVVSDIWREIVKENTYDILKLIELNNYHDLKNLYDNYHDSPLAIGADDSTLLKNPIFRLRAAKRHQHQLYNYLIHLNVLPLPNKFQPNIGIKKNVSESRSIVAEIFKKLSNNINFDQFYRFKYKDLNIPIDFLDHLYFYDVIESFVVEPSQNFAEIGGGTGTLSLILSELGGHNVTMVDLAPFLINQRLLVGSNHTYLPSEYITSTQPRKIKYLVNQDSFPEISNTELLKLIKFMNQCDVEYIFSYNQTSNYRGQTDYSSIIKSNGFLEIVSYVSPMRKGYKVKIFQKY